MAYVFQRTPAPGTAAIAPVLAAARCWRAARDAGHRVQPCLTAALRPYDGEMLVPCLDSLLACAEAALGRPFRVTEAGSLSDDEHLLLDLCAGVSRTRACFECGEGIARAFECALCSTRVTLALEHPGLPEQGVVPWTR